MWNNVQKAIKSFKKSRPWVLKGLEYNDLIGETRRDEMDGDLVGETRRDEMAGNLATVKHVVMKWKVI